MKGNVFEQIGFSPQEAAALKMKSELHSQIIKSSKKRGYTQADLQKRLHETQPRVSDLMTGKISKFRPGDPNRLCGGFGLAPANSGRSALTNRRGVSPQGGEQQRNPKPVRTRVCRTSLQPRHSGQARARTSFCGLPRAYARG